MPTESVRKTTKVKCLNCGKWFRSGFQINDEALKTITLKGNTEMCPNCQRETPVGKENMKNE